MTRNQFEDPTRVRSLVDFTIDVLRRIRSPRSDWITMSCVGAHLSTEVASLLDQMPSATHGTFDICR